MYNTLKNRLENLETGARMGETDFTLGDGVHSRIRRRELLDAIGEAVTGRSTFRARVMLNATSASDGSRLHELCQALASGPAPCGKTIAEIESERNTKKEN